MADRTTRSSGHDFAPDAGTSPEEWRLFVAIDIGAAAREAIRAAQERCRREGFPLRPVDPAGAHLTLRFLGATDPARVPALGAALQMAATGQTAFALHTAAPGAFPGVARARVLWLGLAGPLERLMALQRATEAALADGGVPRETRPFAPHLTIGRIAVPPPAARTAALLAMLSATAAPLPVTALHLVRSTLGPGGTRYTTLVTVPLPGAI